MQKREKTCWGKGGEAATLYSYRDLFIPLGKGEEERDTEQ